MPETGLGNPPAPDRLRAFPPAALVSELHRLSESPTPWWFSRAGVEDRTGGRFDLPRPDGTCYTAESLDGALIEKLVRTRVKVVPAERLGELFHTVIEVRRHPATADLAAAGATGFGVNSEIHSTLDYRVPRRWAMALRRAGWRGLRHLLRGDSTGAAAGRALFGASGLHHHAPAGMRTRIVRLDRDAAARLLAERNVEVRPIPADVPLTRPADRGDRSPAAAVVHRVSTRRGRGRRGAAGR